MNTLIILPLMLVMLIATFCLLFWKLASRSNNYADSAEWFRAFSVDSYAPLERLLDPRDFQFLKAQPGYRPEMAKRLVRERKQIFLSYLRLMTGDFNQLLRFARVMIVYSAQDQADFARALWRQQMAFYGSVCAVRLRVAIYPLAWSGPGVSKLLGAVVNLRKQVQEMGFEPLLLGKPT